RALRRAAVGRARGQGMKVAVTVGVFDGLHRGHLEIVKRAIAHAAGGRTVMVSFDPHPDVVLAPSFHPLAPLTPLAEKRERALALGIDRLDLLPFTREMASLPPHEFVDRYLIERHGLTALVVGE